MACENDVCSVFCFQKLQSDYEETIKKSIDHLIKSFDEQQDDVYPLAVTAYALQLADHEQKETILDSLVKYAIERGFIIHLKNVRSEKCLFSKMLFDVRLQMNRNGGIVIHRKRMQQTDHQEHWTLK